MNPILKIFLKLLAITVIIILVIQLNNLYCLNFNKCRPFFLSYYYSKFQAKDKKQFTIKTNYKLINNNKNVDVTIDFDKTYSKISDIVKVKLIYRNLTNNRIIVKNNFSYDYPIFSEFITMFKCPCSSKIIINPNESKMVEIEFFYNLMVSKKTMNEMANIVNFNGNLIYKDNATNNSFLVNNVNLVIN